MVVRLPTPRNLLALMASLASLLVLATPTLSTQGRQAERGRTRIRGLEAAEGEVLVKFRTGTASPADAAIAWLADAEPAERLDRVGVRRVRSRSLRTEELVDRLRAHPDVEFVEPNYVVYASALPDDPSLGSLWGLLNTGSNPVGGGGLAGADIDITAAWDRTTGSTTHVVGIVDSGVDYGHPDLAANMWSAPAPFEVTIAGQTITCPAGSHGFDAVARTCDPADVGYHGTHVAGTIGAVGNNGLGSVGVNWTTRMMALRFLGSGGTGYVSDAIAAIEFAIQAKAAFAATGGANVRVLNNSWGGGGYSQALVTAITAADAADILFVAAAGNNATNNDTLPFYPAAYALPNIVAVAASDSGDRLSGFSNYGATSVHLAAPGSAILSTMPSAAYGVLQGTSMAAPHVSGAAALTLAACSATTAELKGLLLAGVDTRPAFATTTVTGGRLNAARTLDHCVNPRVTGLTLTPNLPAPQGVGTTVTWTAVASGGVAPYQYQWVVFDGFAWNTASDWSASDTFNWTPVTASAAYQVAVRARSAWNTGTREMARGQAYEITPPRVTGLTLTPEVAAPQPVGTTVTWRATATGGQAPYQYQWVLFDGVDWTTMTEWSTSATFAWTPGSANAGYQVFARARSAWNTGDREMAAGQAFAIVPSVTGLTLAPNLPAPQAAGTTVTWTAAATGGVEPYQYQWVVFDGANWNTVTEWSTRNTFAWVPATANPTYQVFVRARSAWNMGAREKAAGLAFAITPSRITGLTLSPNLTAPQAVGTTVTWTASASGGQAPYQYQWVVYDGVTWTTTTGWSTSPTYAWMPTSANTAYQVFVRARSAWNTGDRELAAGQAFAVPPGVSGLTLSPGVPAPQGVGTTISWTATASGGQAPYQYQWVVFDGTTWATVTDWSTSATFAWTPSIANPAYQVAVRARSAWNTGTREMARGQAFEITPPRVTALTLTPNLTAPRAPGTTMTWTAAASGGQAPYQYQWVVYDGATWTTMTGWSTSPTFTWTPAGPNAAYQVFVRARSAWNTGTREMAAGYAFPIQ